MTNKQEYNFNEKDLKLLNSNKGLKLLLQGLDANKALRYVKYEKEIEKLQMELIKLQKWVQENDKKLVIVFEGRDAAGKGGAIRRITHHLNPRYYRKVALPKPTEEEKGQWYFQRYVQQLANKGEIVLFDRSWYNRAVVEPVNGFCTQEEYERFMGEVVNFENMITSDGLILIKLYFSINKSEQAHRFNEISNNPLKRWKMTPVDLAAQDLWETYTKYKKKMFEVSHTDKNPWVIIEANKKTKARVEAIKYLLKTIPYKN
ncbi:MAG: polyphosphate kinase 2 [Schleiferiaceae bacterium]|jgi:polyphosphate kinase 2|nr:polyphosphate kinase 2 [Schleiferiaceae bacterium]